MLRRKTTSRFRTIVALVVFIIKFWDVRVRNIHTDVAVVLVPDFLPVVLVAHQRETLERVTTPEEGHHVAVLGCTPVFPRFARD